MSSLGIMGGVDNHKLFYDSLMALKTSNAHKAAFKNARSISASNFSKATPGPGLRLANAPLPSCGVRQVLGISAHYHDAAAALIVDGNIVAFAQEERFTRRKHDARFPSQAISFCLMRAGLKIADLDLVAFYEEPFLKVDRILSALVAMSPASEEFFGPERFSKLARQFGFQIRLKKLLDFDGPICFVQHHLSHAASAFYTSCFEEAACLVVDAVGEWATASLHTAGAEGISTLEQINYPHSLGMFYSAITSYLGFAVNNDEYKVMALAAYGKPAYRDKLEQVLKTFPDGSFALDLNYFLYAVGSRRLYSPELTDLLGIPPRSAKETVRKEHADLACSLQAVLEDALAGLLRRAHQLAPSPNLVMAGGVALNGVANYRTFKTSQFEKISIQPAAGDAGGALGAALFAYHEINRTQPHKPRSLFDPYLGPDFQQEEVERILREQSVAYEKLSWDHLLTVVSKELCRGSVVGWFQGRMEAGPRALGGRSILANPIIESMNERVNSKIKFREQFRPFAPAIPEEHAREYFDVDQLHDPLYYMLFVLPVVREQSERIPAVIHVDGSTRPQLVSKQTSPRFHALLCEFQKHSGVPVLLNTSFNLASEPIVCTPQDALKTFSYSDMDLLVMERCLIRQGARSEPRKSEL